MYIFKSNITLNNFKNSSIHNIDVQEHDNRRYDFHGQQHRLKNRNLKLKSVFLNNLSKDFMKPMEVNL